MRTIDKVLAPLRASRAAMVPYVEDLQSGYHSTEKFARAKAHELAQMSPRAARIFTNRYVLLSLAAGVCLYAAGRLRRWRANHAHRAVAKPTRRPAVTKSSTSAPRKHSRTTVRSTQVH